jgi:hypothetical protein
LVSRCRDCGARNGRCKFPGSDNAGTFSGSNLIQVKTPLKQIGIFGSHGQSVEGKKEEEEKKAQVRKVDEDSVAISNSLKEALVVQSACCV